MKKFSQVIQDYSGFETFGYEIRDLMKNQPSSGLAITNDIPSFFYEPTSQIREKYLESLNNMKKQAEQLKSSPTYSDVNNSILSKEIFDHNPFAVEVELDRIEKLVPINQKIIKDYNKKDKDVSKYKIELRDQLGYLKSKIEFQDLESSTAVSGASGRMLGVEPDKEIANDQNRGVLESLERLIRKQQEDIADIEAYMFGLITGTEQFSPFAQTIAHTNAKFVKLAEDLEKTADEEIEEYYNDLYEDSEGSPEFGTALEHPDENRNKLTEDIKRHSKFKKI